MLVGLRVSAYKWRRLSVRWFGEFVGMTLKPLSLEAMLGYLLGLVVIVVLAANGNTSNADDSLLEFRAYLRAAWLVLPWWLFFCAIVALLKALRPKDLGGNWDSVMQNRFIFNEPKFVSSITATPERNGELVRFKIPFAPGRSVCRLILNPADGEGIRLIVHGPYLINKLWAENPPTKDIAVLIGKSKEAYLSWELRNDSLPVTIRVCVDWFELQHPSIGKPHERYDMKINVLNTDCYMVRPDSKREPVSVKFENLLQRMLHGVSAKETLASRSRTSGKAVSEGSSETQTRQDKGADISGTHEHKSPDKRP